MLHVAHLEPAFFARVIATPYPNTAGVNGFAVSHSTRRNGVYFNSSISKRPGYLPGHTLTNEYQIGRIEIVEVTEAQYTIERAREERAGNCSESTLRSDVRVE